MQARGVKATVDGKIVLVGNPALLLEAGVTIDQPVAESGRTPVHVAVDGKLVGVIFIADTLRQGARAAIASLKESGVKRVVMLTGDNAATANAIANLVSSIVTAPGTSITSDSPALSNSH